jgi:hypothetical protein
VATDVDRAVPGGRHLHTSRGHALIGRALYLPGACAADEEQRELAGVPEQVTFATKPELAGAAAAGHPASDRSRAGC